VLDRLDPDRSSEMRLARAGGTNQDHLMSVLQELLSVELANERFVHLAAGEVEAVEVAIVREAGGFELIGR